MLVGKILESTVECHSELDCRMAGKAKNLQFTVYQ